MTKAKLLSEAEIERLAGELTRCKAENYACFPFGWETSESLLATARAYHRLGGLVEAIGKRKVSVWARESMPAMQDPGRFGDMADFYVAVCRRVLAEDGGEAKQETKTGGTER